MARTKQTARKTTTTRPSRPSRQYYASAAPVNASKPKVVNLVDLDYTLDPTCMKIIDITETLQRAMVQAAKGDDGINEKDIPDCDQLFKELAQLPMTPQYLRHTKVAKVMKQIRDMEKEKIPSETEYKFKDRAGQFIASWTNLTGVKYTSLDA
ncbi:hypothetical protein SCHPADRAFT_904332 [Schizopora paradoxa]|uniref:TFIIS N-terminal domain-containing protein n=1 Tax=Schizopora paradoxa TaxID=27342 RepID=A0A0H2RMT0_9AGAM|nr:hypothetical protein SCHPADRAFT_904332 [Schizopora paradoxa]